LAGLVVWNYLAAVAGQGCHCFLIAQPYIRQCPSPLAIFPLRTALGGLVHFGLALLIVLAARVWLRGWPDPTTLLALVPAVALFFAFAWSLALLAGFANVVFRDTEHLVQVGLQILFYGTPVISPAELLDGYPTGWLLWLNPFVPFLQL